MRYNISDKKFRKKWPCDEWFEKSKGKWIMRTFGNLKKWISVKYYGHEEG